MQLFGIFSYAVIHKSSSHQLEPSICRACATKFYYQDFVLKYVAIGGKKDFQVESGLFRNLFWCRRDLLSLIVPKCKLLLKMRKNDYPILRREKINLHLGEARVILLININSSVMDVIPARSD